MTVLLYHGLASTCSKKVRLALYEKGVAFESRLLDLSKQEQKAPEYLALNPNGIVPTLVHEGRPIVESSVILEYVEDAFSGPPLRPAEPELRAKMRLWLRFSDEVAYHAVAAPTWKFMQERITRSRAASAPQTVGKPKFNDEDFTAAAARMELTLNKLDAALAGRDWLVGNAFSLADAAMLPFVTRIRNLQSDLVARDLRPALCDWLDRAANRPSFARAIDFTEDPRATEMPNI